MGLLHTAIRDPPPLPSRVPFKDTSIKPDLHRRPAPHERASWRSDRPGARTERNAIPSPATAVLGGNWVRAGQPIHLIQTPPLHSAFSLQSFQSKEAWFPLQHQQNKLSPCSLISELFDMFYAWCCTVTEKGKEKKKKTWKEDRGAEKETLFQRSDRQ